MGRFDWLIIIVTISIIALIGCDSSPTGGGGGGGGGGPYPSLGGEWAWQHPLPQGNDLLAVDFINDNLGIAVGKGGTIIRTTNGGSSWNAVDPITNNTLTDVKFTDNQTVFAVGNDDNGQCQVYRSLDAGLNWATTDMPSDGWVEALAVASEDVIYAGGISTILSFAPAAYLCATTNSGQSWSRLQAGIQAGIMGLHFVQEEVGFAACGDGKIYQTLNGGDDWSELVADSEHPFTDIAFFGIENGWASVGLPYVGISDEPQLFVSNYNGEVWEGVNFPWNISLNSLSMPVLGTIIAGGFERFTGYVYVPIVMVSSDGGHQWTMFELYSFASDADMVNDLDFVDGNKGWIVGPSNFIAHTDNAGNSFTSQSQIGTSEYELMDVEFVNSWVGWAVGALHGDSALVLHTVNGGDSWERFVENIIHPFRAITFPESFSGWAASDSGKVYQLIGINDQGWIERSTGTLYTLNDILFTDLSSGWVVGDMGTLMTTTDGIIWTPIDLGTTENLLCIEFITDSIGFVGGEGGAFYRTDDAGENWGALDAPANYDIVALSFTDADTGWAGTASGYVLRTYDGGVNLTSLANVGAGMLSDIEFVSTVYGFICGPDGMIWTSTDRGSSWSDEISGTDLDLNRFFFRGDDEGWVVGKGGAILHWQP